MSSSRASSKGVRPAHGDPGLERDSHLLSCSFSAVSKFSIIFEHVVLYFTLHGALSDYGAGPEEHICHCKRTDGRRSEGRAQSGLEIW